MAKSKENSPASVRQRLLNLARDKGQVFDVVLVAYGLERLMHRLSISEHRDSFVLGIPTNVPAGLSAQFFADPQKTRQWLTYAASISLEGVSLENVIYLIWTNLAPACALVHR